MNITTKTESYHEENLYLILLKFYFRSRYFAWIRSFSLKKINAKLFLYTFFPAFHRKNERNSMWSTTSSFIHNTQRTFTNFWENNVWKAEETFFIQVKIWSSQHRNTLKPFLSIFLLFSTTIYQLWILYLLYFHILTEKK